MKAMVLLVHAVRFPFFVVTSVLDCKMPLFQGSTFLFSRFTCKSANRGVVPLLSIVWHADVRVTVCGRKV